MAVAGIDRAIEGKLVQTAHYVMLSVGELSHGKFSAQGLTYGEQNRERYFPRNLTPDNLLFIPAPPKNGNPHTEYHLLTVKVDHSADGPIDYIAALRSFLGRIGSDAIQPDIAHPLVKARVIEERPDYWIDNSFVVFPTEVNQPERGELGQSLQRHGFDSTWFPTPILDRRSELVLGKELSTDDVTLFSAQLHASRLPLVRYGRSVNLLGTYLMKKGLDDPRVASYLYEANGIIGGVSPET